MLKNIIVRIRVECKNQKEYDKYIDGLSTYLDDNIIGSFPESDFYMLSKKPANEVVPVLDDKFTEIEERLNKESIKNIDDMIKREKRAGGLKELREIKKRVISDRRRKF